MDIDISVLRLMEREKDVPFEVLAKAIEEALLTAYERTEGAVPGARCSCTETGHVTVMVPETDEDGQQVGEHDATPEGFGRHAQRSAPSDHAALAGRGGRAEVRAFLGCRG